MKSRMQGLSGKEIEAVSYLELQGKRFFMRKDIRRFFKNSNELNVYIHRLSRKGRIARINKGKYYLLPIQAFRGRWSEHPFIVVDEIFNSSSYCIGGKSAAHFWGLIEQIPAEIEVFSVSRQGKKKIMGLSISFRRVRRLPRHTKRAIRGHSFLIATKEESERWI